MAKIDVNDLNQGKQLKAEDLTQVKGGGGYIKLGSIKGESNGVTDNGGGPRVSRRIDKSSPL